jgi:ribose transport system permease protein
MGNPAMKSDQKSVRSFFRSNAIQQLLAFGALILLLIGFSLASPYFRTVENMIGILLATSVNGILALGVTFVIISAGIDLSVGTMMTISAVMIGVFITNNHFPVWLGILFGIITGGLAGFVNGFVISKLKIPPFIATLGMFNVAKCLSLVISGLRPIYFNGPPVYNQLAMGSLLDLSFISPNLKIPNAVLFYAIAAFFAWFILQKTILGRYTFALGSNEEATRLSGVNVDAWKIAVYSICGLFAGLAGFVISARLNSAQPALGSGYELDAIAATVIGGTSLSGGEGTIIGSVIGAFIISTLTNGLRILGVPQEWQLVVTGVIVVTAVFADVVRKHRK